MKYRNAILYTLILLFIAISIYFMCPSFLHESYTDSATSYSDMMQKTEDDLFEGKLKPVPTSGLPPGWYSLNVMNMNLPESPISIMMAPISDGCKLNDPIDPKSGIVSTSKDIKCRNDYTIQKKDPNKTSSTPTSTPDPKDETKYNPNDPNEIYHYDEKTPQEKEAKETNFDVDLSLLDISPLYNEPGSYVVDSTGYVPNYSDSLYLSTTSGMSQTSKIVDAPYLFGGFCAEKSANKQDINTKCNTLEKDVCGSTECCVLLGGEKCVAGNANGPSISSVYNDSTIVNRDFYYYSGKCYGNCPNSYFGPAEFPPMQEDTQNAMNLQDEALFDTQLNNEFNYVVDAGKTPLPTMPTMYPELNSISMPYASTTPMPTSPYQMVNPTLVPMNTTTPPSIIVNNAVPSTEIIQ